MAEQKGPGQRLYEALERGTAGLAEANAIVDAALMRKGGAESLKSIVMWRKTSHYDYTLAHAAVMGGELASLQLLERAAEEVDWENEKDAFSLNMIDSGGRTAAMVAAYQGKDAILREICDWSVAHGRELEMLIVGQQDTVAGNAAEKHRCGCLRVLCDALPAPIALALMRGEGELYNGEGPEATPHKKAKHSMTEEVVAELLERLYVCGFCHFWCVYVAPLSLALTRPASIHTENTLCVPSRAAQLFTSPLLSIVIKLTLAMLFAFAVSHQVRAENWVMGGAPHFDYQVFMILRQPVFTHILGSGRLFHITRRRGVFRAGQRRHRLVDSAKQ
jgi:hypothetical protein